MSTFFAKFHTNESVSSSMFFATKTISVLFGIIAFVVLFTENIPNIQPLGDTYSFTHFFLLIIAISTISLILSIGVLYMLLVFVSNEKK